MIAGAAEAIDELLAPRLEESAAAWLARARAEIAQGVDDSRHASRISLASRYAPRGAANPSAAEVARAGKELEGWNPERWTVLELVRAALVLARSDLEAPSFSAAFEEFFRYADEGELCALYRCLPLLPDPERFAPRAAEGCRSNMRSVFEAVATDNPYPARYFDDIAWHQLVMKALFVEAPLWRVVGLDSRLSPELARMALDYVEERRSAGRPIPPELWLCLGPHGGERGLAALEREVEAGDLRGRRGAILGLMRAGAKDRLERLEGTVEKEEYPELRDTLTQALAGKVDQSAFAKIAVSE
ncbi:MAG: EboA domain-containing protein [Deltaproteobacteria bacterium]|nr:EboA domain-containing protein [Deltaproteobacteria bacterium]MBW2421124.1 EboA domain-containing protein [Deltaproteobacteria bacterium]